MAHTLISSDRVETALVYGLGDEKIGTIERLMLEKKSGTVAYAVVRCGGLLKVRYIITRYLGIPSSTMWRVRPTQRT